MVESVLIPVIVAVLAGTLTWFVKERIEIYRDKMAWRGDCRYFAGNWYGAHLTKGDSIEISHHRYELKVARNGRTGGILTEESTKPEWKYRVDGRVGAGGWFMRSQSITRPDEFAIEFYFNDVDEKRMRGFLIGYDLNKDPFCSFSLLSRKPITKEDYLEEYKKNIHRLYLP